MTVHNVSIEPRWFERIRLHEKTSEVRWAGDRDYQAGDVLRCQRGDMDGSRESHYVERVITHVLHADHVGGLADGWVVLSLRDPRVELLQDRLAMAVDNAQSLARSNAIYKAQNRKLRAGQ